MEQNIYHEAATHLKRNFDFNNFQKYFLASSQNFNELAKIIKNCEIDPIHCRFNVWRLCLGVVSVNSTVQQKGKQIKESREKYQEKKQEALKYGQKKSPLKQPTKKNPLLMMGTPKVSTETKQAESDEFLKQQIQKDVQRTYQQMRFFQDKHILKMLSLILFIWCRRNPDVSYKQGMNQLLASVVVCYFKEAEFTPFNQRPEGISEELWPLHYYFNSVEFAQSDIYAVFQKIIQIQGQMYKTQADLSIKLKVNPNSKNNTPILQRIIQIKDHKLKHMDLELFRIIKIQDVQTKSFMLRWIRCMHTRQFDLENSFTIWDSIFLEYQESENSKKNKQFQFIDAMCLAMFMYMRSIVFTKQTAGQILHIYQKYPSLKRGEYLDELIALAWSICQELRIQGLNHQPSQSNWFQQSSKVQSLHFMDKKLQIKPIQNKSKPNTPSHQIKHHQHKELQQKNTKNVVKSPISTKDVHDNGHTNQNNQKKRTKPAQHHVNPHSHSQKITQKQHPKPQNKIIQSSHQEKNNLNSLKPDIKQTSTSAEKDKTSSDLFVETEQQPSYSIKLQNNQLKQMLQHLNQTLQLVRDVDAISHIKKVIKKLQTKIKAVKELQKAV